MVEPDEAGSLSSRALDLLDDLAGSRSAEGWDQRAIAEVAALVGCERAVLFVGSAPAVDMAVEPADGIGLRAGVLDAYVSRFRADDIILTPCALASMRQVGVVTLSDVAPRDVRDQQRRYVERFLVPNDFTGQVTMWLPSTGPHDRHRYLTLLPPPGSTSPVELAMLVRLRRVLADLLRPRPQAVAATPLTPREQEVLALVLDGLGNRAIARRLGTAEATVKKHVTALLAKSGCRSRAELMARTLAH